MDFVAIDFETANYARDSACAVGIVVVEQGAIVHQQSWLIRPPNLFFQFTYLHGIAPQNVIHEPTFDQLWPALLPFLDGQTLAAHNASFDMGVLLSTLNHYGLPHPSACFLDTVAIARKTWPTLPNHKLNTVAAHLGVSLRHHDALDDSHSAAQIVLHAGKIHSALTIEELISSLGLRQHHVGLYRTLAQQQIASAKD